MALFVHHGPRLAPLADELAARLAAPPAALDPFEPIVVAVPTAGVRDWLTRRLAGRLGITANVAMPFPGRFVAAALGTALDADDPWDVDRLTWAVLEVLDSEPEGRDVPGWQPPSATATTATTATATTAPEPSRRFTVARTIADLFDRYATNRPAMLRHWHAGIRTDGTLRATLVGGGDEPDDAHTLNPLPAAMEWQFHLWRAVRAAIGVASPAEQLPDLVARLSAGELQPALPNIVELFGVSTVSSLQLAVLRALAEVRDVHVSVLHPSPVAWHRTPALDHHRPIPRARGGDPDGGHPLLRAWARLDAETAALVRGLGPAATTTGPATDAPDDAPATLLGHLQADLLADRPPTSFVPRPDDTSVQVHACHGPIRQLEVLRDVLGHLFVADPTLRPDDVLVLCPDLARFEPFAAAVFGRSTLPVPVTASDLSLGSENPVAAALALVLRMTAGRCTAADVLAVAALDPVRHRLGITLDDLDRFRSWTERLGTSWGLDRDHRRRWLDADIAAGTWDAAVRAVLVGAAMPAPEPRLGLADVAPYDDVGADDVPVAGRLAELVARLRHVRAATAEPRPIAAWCDTLADTVALFCATAPGDAWQVAAVTTAIDELRAAAVVADGQSTASITLDDVLAVVDRAVTGRRGRLRLRTGRVALTGVAAVRNVPAKVVCLLGFDEASLRPPTVDGDDLLTVRPCVGERDRRAERRHVLLDALLAAEDTLVVVCDGNDVTTNRPTRFAVPLTELLDVVDETVVDAAPDTERGDRADRSSSVLHRHPLRAFDPRNFDAGALAGVAGVFGFDDVMRRAAEIRHHAVHTKSRRWDVDVAASPSVTLAQLVDACAQPARTLVRDGLDVRLPGEVTDADPNIPLAIAPLAAANAGQRLLDRYHLRAAELRVAGAGGDDWAAQAADVVVAWAAAERLSGAAPPERLADHALAAIAADVDRLVVAAAEASGVAPLAVLAPAGAVDVHVDVGLAYAGGLAGLPAVVPGELRLVDTVSGVAAGGGGLDGGLVCRLRYKRPSPRQHIAAALEVAALVLATGRSGWRAVSVARPQRGSMRPQRLVVDVVAADDPQKAARALLEAAAELRVAALGSAVPLFEKASHALYHTGALDEELLLGNDYYSGGGDLTDAATAFVWGDTTVTELGGWSPPLADVAALVWGSIDNFVAIDELKDNVRNSNGGTR